MLGIRRWLTRGGRLTLPPAALPADTWNPGAIAGPIVDASTPDTRSSFPAPDSRRCIECMPGARIGAQAHRRPSS
jgi:hypothetical protein